MKSLSTMKHLPVYKPLKKRKLSEHWFINITNNHSYYMHNRNRLNVFNALLPYMNIMTQEEADSIINNCYPVTPVIMDVSQ